MSLATMSCTTTLGQSSTAGWVSAFALSGQPVLAVPGCIVKLCRQFTTNAVSWRSAGIDELKDDPSAPYSYYTYSPRPGWRLIVLDG